jgi:hypothetical protein
MTAAACHAGYQTYSIGPVQVITTNIQHLRDQYLDQLFFCFGQVCCVHVHYTNGASCQIIVPVCVYEHPGYKPVHSMNVLRSSCHCSGICPASRQGQHAAVHLGKPKPVS